jgi:hypothetical protein
MSNQLDFLNKIPKEHWTEHNGKSILIKDLLKLLNEEDTNNGTAGRGKNHARQPSRPNARGGSPKRRRNKKRNS